MICPVCRSSNCFRSHRSGVLDYSATLLGVLPWRCHSCERRFYANRVALPFARYVHCPRCGNFDLEHIPAERVNWGIFIALKRWLGFPAYRCDPCRRKFFSALPFRRIVPSTLTNREPRASSSYS